jgi:hypothetical protein
MRLPGSCRLLPAVLRFERMFCLFVLSLGAVFKITRNPGGNGWSFWCGIEVALGLVRRVLPILLLLFWFQIIGGNNLGALA